jgi:hypothetical protein
MARSAHFLEQETVSTKDPCAERLLKSDIQFDAMSGA